MWSERKNNTIHLQIYELANTVNTNQTTLIKYWHFP